MYGSVSGPGGGTGGYRWLFSPNSEPNCIRDKVDSLLGRCIIHADISAARTQDEGVNIDVWKKKAIFSCYFDIKQTSSPLLEPHGSGKAPLHIQNNAVKFRRRYQSHFEAPGLHLFVGAAEHCSDDGDNSSNPTLHYTLHTKHRHTCANTPEQLGLCVPLITVFNTGVFTVLL